VSRLGPPVLGRGPAIRSGPVPALADGFTNRPESAPGLAGLDPGTAVALVCAAASRPEQPAGPCGKTQLAVQAAESLWRSGRVELLAWIDASSRASVLSGYGEAAAAAGIRSAGPAEEVAARLTSWLADTARPWLVVLDDVHDAADLAGLWPCGPAGRVVITSPDEQAVSGEKSEFQPQVCPVGPFSTREALNYLMGRLADDPDQRHGAIDLAATLDGDPVALTHASAVIATTTQSCADYQRHYAHKRTRMAARQAHGEPLVAPAVTWILSAERASQLSPGGATQLLLVLAALLDGQAVPAAMFTTPATCKYLAESGASAADADRAWEAVRALAHTGLFTIDLAPAPPVVRLSRLVAALVRAATPEQVLERAAVGAADALLEIWPQREPRPWLAAGLRSCVDALQRISADRLWAADACHPLLLKAGHSLDSGGLNGPSVRHWAQLATTGNRILSSGHPDTLAVGSHLAHALQAAGQATEATAWWQWVAAGRARAFGPDHPSTLAARVSLGNAMAAAGQPGSAVGVLEQAVADSERVRGAGHPDTFRARDGLAAAYLADGRLKDAITCYKKTLADRQHALGADHPDTITACRNLAAAYQAAGKIAAALQLCEQVRVGQEQILGADHPDTLACRADLAHAYIGAGRLADAATLLRDTLTRCEQALPPGDPLTGAVRQALTGLAGQ
jgi:tetratricopeptide (TPR) repeat protein